MSAPVIKIEHLSKEYQLGNSLRPGLQLTEALTRGLRSLWRRPETPSIRPPSFKALDDVSLEVQAGDRVAVIGRNGAGKTTLLKILSRITVPTRGRVELRGRVASLLEVGTGFHPELTGRENIFLNGAILGMPREEIRRKFDEILAFAEVEKFVDTPVKRYSSGMYVRLAFAVAAHLEPEILIVDEVLAVGDSRFQEKCMGKMRSIGGEGRTILFVTHQMGMVSQLCNKAVLLDAGKIARIGEPQAVVTEYMHRARLGDGRKIRRDGGQPVDRAMAFTEAFLTNATGKEAAEFGHQEAFKLHVRGLVKKFTPGVCLGAVVRDRLGRKIFTSQLKLDASAFTTGAKEFAAELLIPAPFLTPNEYSFLMALHVPNVEVLDEVEDVCPFRVIDTGSDMALHEGADYGCVVSPLSLDGQSRMNPSRKPPAAVADRWQRFVYDRVLRGPGPKVPSRIAFQLFEGLYHAIVRRGDPLIERSVDQVPLWMPYSHPIPFHLKHFPNYGRNLVRLVSIVQEQSAHFSLIDVGANIGDSIAMIRQASSAPVLAIEGDPFFFTVLERNAEKLGDVTMANAFVGNSDTETWEVKRENGTASLSATLGGKHTVTLDALLGAQPRFASARMLKIDTDGFDGHVLRSAQGYLEKIRPVLFFEYMPDFMTAAGDSPEALRDTLKKLGYGSALVYDNFGDLMMTASLAIPRQWEEFDAYLRGREGQMYADLCVFHQDDEKLFEIARSRELRVRQTMGVAQKEAA